MKENNSAVNEIISLEWEMFTAVNEGEARAACQDDRETFEGMRAAQFGEWSADACEAYLTDLKSARLTGRNLIEEKYIHMMKTTEPAMYEALLARVVLPADSVRALAEEVSRILLEQTCELFDEYPYVSGQGRPLYSTFDYNGVSVETYQLGELLTYSEKTLIALKDHVEDMKNNGVSLARRILEATVKFYGYDSLEKAEAATSKRIEKKGIGISI